MKIALALLAPLLCAAQLPQGGGQAGYDAPAAIGYSGAGVPSNPCATPGAQYRNTSTTPYTFYVCPSAGGNWVGPLAIGSVPTITGSAALKGSSGNAVAATAADIVGLWTTCSSGFMKYDGTCGASVWGSISGTLASQTDLDTSLSAKASRTGIIITDATTSRTLSSSDNGAVLVFSSGSAITVTAPVLTAGFNCLLLQRGAGTITVAASSTTLYSEGSKVASNAQHAAVTVLYTDTNVVQLGGSLK